MLVDLAERQRPVVVQLTTGRRHRGQVVAIGEDVVELATATQRRVLVARSAVSSVRPHVGDEAAQGAAAPVPVGRRLGRELAELAAERPAVLVVTLDGDALAGRLALVGSDVLGVRLDGDAWAYVPLASVAEVSVPESG